MKHQSKRFSPGKWAERTIPLVLGILLLALLAALAIVFLSISGLIPVG